MTELTILDAAAVAAALPMPAAIEAVRTALAGGLDPSADPARTVVPVDHGQLLMMPAQWDRYAGVKVATVAPANPAAGLPRIQGSYLLLDGPTLSPLAILDGIALTAIRTAAVSAVFGSGPQARSHVSAFRAIRSVAKVTVVGRDAERAAEFAAWCGGTVGTAADVAHADLVACCTTARTPLFDGALLPAHATVVAVGSHEPDAVELDAATMTAGTVVVEAREPALREAGDVVAPVAAGLLDPAGLVELAAVVRGADVPRDRPRVFKSVGMAWEDVVLAAETYRGHQRA
jgi:ornithine cyclodeaminase